MCCVAAVCKEPIYVCVRQQLQTWSGTPRVGACGTEGLTHVQSVVACCPYKAFESLHASRAGIPACCLVGMWPPASCPLGIWPPACCPVGMWPPACCPGGMWSVRYVATASADRTLEAMRMQLLALSSLTVPVTLPACSAGMWPPLAQTGPSKCGTCRRGSARTPLWGTGAMQFLHRHFCTGAMHFCTGISS